MGAPFLDGRETKQQNGAMTLRFAALPRQGAPEPDGLAQPARRAPS
jgi:hypothetical protein